MRMLVEWKGLKQGVVKGLKWYWDHILESNNASVHGVKRSVVKGLNNRVAKGLNRGVVKGLNTRCVRPVGKGTYPQDVFVPWSQTQHLSVRIYRVTI